MWAYKSPQRVIMNKIYLTKMYEALKKIPYEIIKKNSQQKITKFAVFENLSHLPKVIRR